MEMWWHDLRFNTISLCSRVLEQPNIMPHYDSNIYISCGDCMLFSGVNVTCDDFRLIPQWLEILRKCYYDY